MVKFKNAKEKVKVFVDWCMKHWVFVIIAAATSYIGVALYKMIKDDGIGPDGKPYYSDFESPKDQEVKNETK